MWTVDFEACVFQGCGVGFVVGGCVPGTVDEEDCWVLGHFRFV